MLRIIAKNALNTAYGIAVVVILINLVFLLFGIRFYTVESESMEPEMKPGSLLLVNIHAKPWELNINDIIVYRHAGSLDVHRVVSVDDGIGEAGEAGSDESGRMAGGGSVTVKGDNNEIEEAIDEYNLVGKYIGGIPFLGSFSEMINGPWLYGTVGFVLALSFVPWWMVGKIAADKGENEKGWA